MYNSEINLLNPTLLVSDQNFNAPLTQLQENDDYLLAFNNGNRHLLPIIYGNLWDYDTDGKRFLYNGGKFDTYKKCHTWAALNQLKIVNDSRILFDSTSSRMVYLEYLNTSATPNPSWLEREIYIPEVLRNQQILFAIKCAGSSAASSWTTTNAVSEVIGVEIMGATQTIQKFFTVGAVSNFNYYNGTRNNPAMTTVFIPFNVDLTTTTVKVKIFRTVTSRFLHIDRIFIGGLTMPFDTYNIQNTDINEFYDFEKGQSKFNATTVLGHTVPSTPTIFGGTTTVSGFNKSDLVTYEGLTTFLREVLNANSLVNVATTSITSTNNFNYLQLSQGSIPLTVGTKIYSISHGKIKNIASAAPSLNIVAPNIPIGLITGANTSFFVHSLYDITDTGFKVILSDSPLISGYTLSWSIGNTFSPLDAVGYMPVTTSINPSAGGNDIIFQYEQVYGG